MADRCALRPSCREGQICDEADDRCFTDCAVEEDADGDGVRSVDCGGLDCDDGDPDRAPGLVEICDTEMHDEDCDPTTFGVRDLDRDDHPDATCCNVVGEERFCGTDCDDARAGVSPTATEVCNELDDDCDGSIDEALRSTVYRDDDFDGHGTGEPFVVCDVAPGVARLSDDCDDGDPDRFPGNPEVCDAAMVDEDCSGTPNDPPGGCECTGSGSEACGTLGVCAGARRECVDGTWTACERVPGTEVCDGTDRDEDCDGMVDESLTVRCYVDADGDGYAPDGMLPMDACPSTDPARAGAPWNGCPAGLTGRAPGVGAVDCCDSDARAWPGTRTAYGTPRACGGFDFDCNGTLFRVGGNSVAYGCTATCSNPGPAGWCGGRVPECGNPGRLGTCLGVAPCDEVSCEPVASPVQCR